ncbi:MAG: iron donor protein CyaY [Pseudomonadota bacterium]|nr:MAG: iron donor protein CyaY [Pseudomonadota bacterium]
MDESLYLRLADETFERIQAALEPLDPDLVDFEFSHDVLQIVFADGARCVINTQRPARQLWLAWDRRAWHFDWDESKGQWLDDKGQGVELLSKVREIVKEKAGAEIAL